MNEQIQLANYCRALGHPVRVEILKYLLNKGTCISGELSGHIDKAQSTVSEHLRILKEAGLVRGVIDGPRRCYCANEVALKELNSLIQALRFHNDCCVPENVAQSTFDQSKERELDCGTL